ncbi:DUF4147 domain-containing protein [Candidatus Parcubacteria bacterium]|nr:DUF4147 domain-containing protein [Candidatus Parcubacteria bacterium]
MPIIKNKQEISGSKARKQAVRLIEAGIKAVQAENLMKKAVRYGKEFNSLIINNNEFDLLTGRIFVIGGGKAAGKMAEIFEKIVGENNIAAGIVNSIEKNKNIKKIKVIKAGHPLPDRAGLKGVEKMLGLKEKYKINKKDLVVCLLSGGGSAMLPAPVDGVSLKDKQKTTDLLIKSGASIGEINAVRKHLSKIKGGQLAEFFAPARAVSVIISDVIFDQQEIIASGPTVFDPAAFQDAYLVLEKYDLITKCTPRAFPAGHPLGKSAPASVIKYIKEGTRGRQKETSKISGQAKNFIIGSNRDALEAIALEAMRAKLKPLIVTASISENVELEVKRIIAGLSQEKNSGYDVLLFGGEPLVSLPKDHGKGGRNRHLSALVLDYLKDTDFSWVFASVSTDGSDYTKNIAGAIVDNNSYRQAIEKKIDIAEHIKNFDTDSLFKKLGNSLIKMDNTNTNVGDVMVFLRK